WPPAARRHWSGWPAPDRRRWSHPAGTALPGHRYPPLSAPARGHGPAPSATAALQRQDGGRPRCQGRTPASGALPGTGSGDRPDGPGSSPPRPGSPAHGSAHRRWYLYRPACAGPVRDCGWDRPARPTASGPDHAVQPGLPEFPVAPGRNRRPGRISNDEGIERPEHCLHIQDERYTAVFWQQTRVPARGRNKCSEGLALRPKQNATAAWGGNGAQARIRTGDLSLRRRLLYPAELQAHGNAGFSVADITRLQEYLTTLTNAA